LSTLDVINGTLDLNVSSTTISTVATQRETTLFTPTTDYISKLYNLPGALPESGRYFWSLIVAPILISIAYWENFIDSDTKLGSFGKQLLEFKKKFHKCKPKTYLFTSIIKIIVAFILVLIYTGFDSSIEIGDLFNSENFYTQKCFDDVTSGIFESDWLEAASIQIAVGVAIFYGSDVAIKSRLQIVCYTVPITLATPVCFLLLFWACADCTDNWNIDTPYFWNCFSGRSNIGELMTERYVYLGFLWWISYLWICRHLWSPSLEKLAKMDR
jgi:hypothetical protein